MMKAVVAVDKNWGIGCKGELLIRIPEDMKNFRRITAGGVVIMGRATFESLPGKAPLKDRVNIVLSRNKTFKNSGVTVCYSIDDLLKELENYSKQDIYCIGGEAIYNQLLQYCDEAIITKIQHEFAADSYFPNLDMDESWKLVSESDIYRYHDILYSYTRYVQLGI